MTNSLADIVGKATPESDFMGMIEELRPFAAKPLGSIRIDVCEVAKIVDFVDGTAPLATLVLEAREALREISAAIDEMFRYYDGGETRGSYDGKPERAQLRKAGYTARAALAKLWSL